ncbi:hypothetical protein HN587_08010 [Candidatus Woesearchaeota archaeon]|jgi:phosphate uptake regulator|nr:hypothetical protein [Candidatus Woesearchaeota archaeon]
MKRKVIQLAGKTHVLSLPCKWVRQYGVKKGDELNLIEHKSSLIINLDKAPDYGRIEVDVSGKNPMIKRILGALYKSGYCEVEVRFSTLLELKQVKEVIREEFIGFEVVDQGKNYLVFKKVSNLESTDYEVMMRRMMRIIIQTSEHIIEAVVNKDYDWLTSIVLIDKDVNKIADFCRRILNTVGNKNYKRTGPGYFIVEQLEKISDMYRDISSYLSEHKIKGELLSSQVIGLFKQTNKFFKMFYELYFNFDLDSFVLFGKQRYLLQKRFEQILGESKFGKNDLKVIMYLNFVVESTFDLNGPILGIKM